MYVKAMNAKRQVMGDPEKEGTQLGPVVDKLQYERIMGIISTARKEKQGTLLYGGNRLGDKVAPLISHAIQ